MGTRHMISVVLDGEMKVAQYGQWDGYPTGQGVDVLDFLRTADLENFKAEVRKLRFLSEDDKTEMAARWDKLGAKNGWATMEQSEKFYADPKYAPLSRDVSASVLQLIADGKVEVLNDSSDFALDSLFCEWAYVVDLDRDVLEVYEGFQKSAPMKGRWAGQANTSPEGTESPEYYAVEMVAEFKLAELPSNEDFVAAVQHDEED